MRKLSISLCILIFAYLIWPYLAVLKLYVGLKSADKEIVMEEIHWPPFRKEIEKDLNRYVQEVLNKNLKQKNAQLSFSSNSLTRQIAEQIATPEGMIYFYHYPDKYVDQIRKIFEKASEPKSLNQKQLSLLTKEKPLKLEGPDFLNLWERINYLFFIDISHFKANFNIKNKPFTIIWERRGFDWKVETLHLPLI